MSAIAKRWTTAGLPANTPLDATNLNAPGNGDEVALPSSLPGSAEFLSTVAGFRVVTTETGAVRRIDAALPAGTTAFRAQCKFTLEAQHTGSISIMGGRTSSGAARTITLPTDRRPSFLGMSAAFAPAIAVGDTLLVNFVVAQSASPTTSNGRLFGLFTNLTNPAWNDTGEVFFDTGYTGDSGAAALTQVRFGKMSQETLPGGARWENLGWEAITVNPAHLSEAQARTYFADPPALVLPPSSGVVRPIPGPGTGGTGWTYAGAPSEGEALSDSSDSTYVESGEIAVGGSTERIYRIWPREPWPNGSTLDIDLRAMIRDMPASGQTPVTTQVKVYNGTTVVATQTVAVGGSLAPATVKLTATQTAALNPAAIDVGLRAAR